MKFDATTTHTTPRKKREQEKKINVHLGIMSFACVCVCVCSAFATSIYILVLVHMYIGSSNTNLSDVVFLFLLNSQTTTTTTTTKSKCLEQIMYMYTSAAIHCNPRSQYAAIATNIRCTRDRALCHTIELYLNALSASFDCRCSAFIAFFPTLFTRVCLTFSSNGPRLS